MKYLKLIRIQNLLLLALMQISFHFGFLKHQKITLAIKDWQFMLLVLATICIAGAGYIINDIFDKEIDLINKPNKTLINTKISESTAYNLYFTLNVIGVGIGFYLSNIIGKPSFSGIFIFIAATLYMYASSLKKSLLIDNLIIAFLSSISVLIIGIFNLYPIINPENQSYLGMLFSILIDYAIFAFIINLIREIIKDMEDLEGDKNYGVKSLPSVAGIKITKITTIILLLTAIISLSYYTYNYIFSNNLNIASVYILALVLAPLILILIRLFEKNTKKDFGQFSLILKLVIFFGILSIYIIEYNKNLI